MSDVEKKVVKVEFDNSKFDKNVKKSSNTLDDFKEKLQFKDVSKSFDAVVKKITALDVITASVINNITNKVVNLGLQLVKSLSIDNISSGWDKFGLKTTSVATIAAQSIKIAGKELTNYEDKLAAINDQLDKLNWFTDETSYNFTDMVNTIGKFTAAGQDLDKSVNAMIGIANWAALSGQNATVASRAMYNLAQAMSKGNVQLIDWRSIETANMATIEFKNTVLETAAAMGKLTKQGDTFISKTGKKITALNFAETLSDKWFTSDILVATLEKYSAAVERIYEIANETGYTASEVMARYSDELDKFGLKAFKAAQEARTFADALNSVKDAVSTGWLNTFEKIFGGYDESRKLWTDLANELYDVFAEGGNFRNQILGIWKDLGGRADLFEHGDGKQGAFWNIYDSIVALINKFKEARDEIFAVSIFQDTDDQAKDLGHQLKNITDRIQGFTEKIKKAVKENTYFKGVLTGVFAILKTIGQVIRGIRYALDPIINLITGVFSDLLDRIGVFGSNLTVLERTFNTIENISRAINAVLTAVLNILDIRGTLNNFFDFIGSIFSGSFDAKSVANDIVNFFNNVGDSISNFKRDINSIVSGNYDKNDPFAPLYAILVGIAQFVKGVWSVVSSVATIIGKTFELIGYVLQCVGDFISGVIKNNLNWKGISTFAKIVLVIGALVLIFVIIRNLFYSIKQVIAPLQYLAEEVGDAIYALGNSAVFYTIAYIIESVGRSLLAIAVAIAFIGSMNTAAFLKGTITLLVFAGLIGGFIVAVMLLTKHMNNASDVMSSSVKSITQFGKNIGQVKEKAMQSLKSASMLSSIASLITALGLAMVTLSISLKIMGSLKWDEWGRGILALVVFTGLVALLMYVTEKCEKTIDVNTIKKFGKSLLAFSLAFTVLAKVLKTFSKIQAGALWNAYGAFAAVSVLFIGLVLLVDFITKKTTKFAIVPQQGQIINNQLNSMISIILSLSAGLFAMSLILKILSTIKPEEMKQAVAGLAAIVISLSGLIMVVSLIPMYKNNTKEIFTTLGAIVSSLLVMALTMLILKNVPVPVIIASLLSFAAMIAVLTITFSLISKNAKTIEQIVPTLIVLGVMSGMLMAFALSMLMLTKIPWQTMLVGAASFSLLILSLAISLNLMKEIGAADVVTLGAGLAILALDMMLFSAALQTFENVNITKAIKGLLLFIATIVVFSVSAALLGSSIPLVLAFSVAIALLATSLMITAVALGILATNIAPFIDSIIAMGPKLSEAVEAIRDFIMNASQSIVDLIVALIRMFCDIIIQSSDSIVEVIKKLISNMIEILPAITELIVAILESVKRIAPEIIEVMMTIVLSVLKALKDNVVELATNLFEFLWKFIFTALDFLIKNLPELIGKLFEIIKVITVEVLDRLPTLIDTLVNKLFDFTIELFDKLGETIATRSAELSISFVKFGKNLMKGLWNGMMAGLGELLRGIPLIGGTLEKLFKETLQIHSPSRMTAKLGGYLMQGFSVGMDAEAPYTMKEATNTISDCVNSAIETAQDIIDDDMDDALVIRPVMDLSNVTAGANSIAGIMSGVGSTSVTADIASKTSREIDRNQNQNGVSTAASTTVNNAGDTYNNVFNITTNDPEELAREVDEIMQRKHTKYTLAKGGAR